jgi:uncharacterized protein YkwD
MLFGAALMASCAAGCAASPGGLLAGAAPADSGGWVEVVDGMAAELNRVRAAHGLTPLRTDPALVRAATAYAAELATRRVLDHDSPTPGRHTHTQRIDVAGGIWRRAAENLANVAGTADDVPARVLTLWLSSDGHRRNVLEPTYTHTGAGVAKDTRGQWYVVQLYTLRPDRD